MELLCHLAFFLICRHQLHLFISRVQGSADADFVQLPAISLISEMDLVLTTLRKYRPGSLGAGRWSDSGCPVAGRCCPLVATGTGPAVQEGRRKSSTVEHGSDQCIQVYFDEVTSCLLLIYVTHSQTYRFINVSYSTQYLYTSYRGCTEEPI